MSQRFLDPSQTVGYIFEDKTLVVTVSAKTAAKMLADGWTVHCEKEIGHFVKISHVEVHDGDS